MPKFNFEVKDTFFPQTFTGDIEASSKAEAERMLKEEYAYELDTTEDQITVTFVD